LELIHSKRGIIGHQSGNRFYGIRGSIHSVDITVGTQHKPSSHNIADDLRALYGLPKITNKPSPEVIKELKGMLNDYADNEWSAVDVIKDTREDIY
jgi:hypothetical protein